LQAHVIFFAIGEINIAEEKVAIIAGNQKPSRHQWILEAIYQKLENDI
jgi:hypothetical protein